MQIETRNLGIEISKKNIFSGVSIRLEGNKLIAIKGRSGSGKTTLLNCLGLIQESSSGRIFLEGHDVTHLKERNKTRFWHDKASFIYQDYGIIENESVLFNITLDYNKKKFAEADKILSRVGLQGRGYELAVVLSGGEKQRLGIARAIYKKAKYIFADEPTASLDFRNRLMVLELLKERVLSGSMVIIATHDERLIKECDMVVDIEKSDSEGRARR